MIRPIVLWGSEVLEKPSDPVTNITGDDLKLVQDMRARKADYFGPRTKEAVITCSVCHRGKAEPEPFVP